MERLNTKVKHMSGDETPDFKIGPTGPMYIVDLLNFLKARNQTSWQEALAIIRMTWRYGPNVVKAEMLDKDICLVRTHIGYGLDAVIEMERDREGEWQPVIGQIVKR